MIETALDRPLNILHVYAAEEARGGEYQTLALIGHLARLGHRQTLLAPAGAPVAAEVCSRGVEVLPLSLPAIVRLSLEYDLVHAHDTRAHSMAAATGRAPVVATRRVTPVRRGPGFRWKHRRTARFIAVSHYVEQQLLHAGILPERISVVYDGAEPAAAERDGDASLVVAAETSRILEEAAHLARTTVEVSSDLDRARLFLYIVHAESSGFPVMEAMARGIPVIASRVGALPEVVEDGHTGLLTANEAQSVASAIARITENGALAAEFSANARARIKERFTTEQTAHSTLDVYRQVLAPPSTSE